MNAATAAVIVVTPEELQRIVRQAVREEVASMNGGAGRSEFMTRAQVAELLDVHEASVVSYVKKNGLKGSKIAGGEWRFRRVDVMAWVEKQRGT